MVSLDHLVVIKLVDQYISKMNVVFVEEMEVVVVAGQYLMVNY